MAESSSNFDDDDKFVPEEILQSAKEIKLNALPEKSKEIRRLDVHRPEICLPEFCRIDRICWQLSVPSVPNLTLASDIAATVMKTILISVHNNKSVSMFCWVQFGRKMNSFIFRSYSLFDPRIEKREKK